MKTTKPAKHATAPQGYSVTVAKVGAGYVAKVKPPAKDDKVQFGATFATRTKAHAFGVMLANLHATMPI